MISFAELPRNALLATSAAAEFFANMEETRALGNAKNIKEGAEIGAFGANQLSASFSLGYLMTKAGEFVSLERAVSVALLVVVQKGLEATSFVTDTERVKCYSAIGNTAVNFGLAITTSETGIGLVVGALGTLAAIGDVVLYCAPSSKR